jgi:hypothetical protein
MVISAFPACGKSWIFKNKENANAIILDSDSSEFSWIINEDGTKERNPQFPDNYITHIKDNIGKADIIFVSSHLKVREAMANANIEYVTVYPDAGLKEEWLGRCFCRGNDISFLNFQRDNWDNFMKSISDEPHGDGLYRLSAGQHLSDIIDEIADDWDYRSSLKNKADNSLMQFDISDKEIKAIVDGLDFKERVDDGFFKVSKNLNRRIKDYEFFISCKDIDLGHIRNFIGKKGAGFIVNNYEGGYMIWPGGNHDEMRKFCQEYIDSFSTSAEKICNALGIQFDESKCNPSMDIVDSHLMVSVHWYSLS